jgi:protein phosphatase
MRFDGNENTPDGQIQQSQGIRLLPNDFVLLCSDGLTDLVNDDEILAAFHQGTMEEAGQVLVNLANQRGGHDNITLIGIQIPELVEKTAAVPAPAAFPVRSRAVLAGCLGIIVLAVLVGSVTGGWLLFSGEGKATPTVTATMTASPSPSPTGPTRTPTRTRTPSRTPSPKPFASNTPTRAAPVNGPTLTPWPTNTPGLPVVTLAP